MKSCRYCKKYTWKTKRCRLHRKRIEDVYTANKCEDYKEVSPTEKVSIKRAYRHNWSKENKRFYYIKFI